MTNDNRKCIYMHKIPSSHPFFQTKLLIFFFFLYENMCCRYSLEVPHQCLAKCYLFTLKNDKNNSDYCWVQFWLAHPGLNKITLKSVLSLSEF